jgi:acyl-CoA thioester hydrolase
MGFTLTWAGECSAWECDEIGHLNMRHYVYKVAEARAGLFVRMGLPHAFKSNASSTVRVKDFHIKYQAEARPGNPLKIESGLVSLEETTAKLCHIMYHADGRIAATILEEVEHIYLHGIRPFPWPSRVRKTSQGFTVTIPAPAQPRNIDLSKTQSGLSLDKLNTLGLKTLGAGVFDANEADLTGFITPQAFFGRVTSSIGWYGEGWPEMWDEDYRTGGGTAALLEARVLFHKYPEAGDAYSYVPGFLGADSYTRGILHNLVDPLSGENYMTKVAVGCLFHMKTRKLVKTSPDQVARLNENAIRSIQY